MKILVDLIGAIILHIIIVAILGLLGAFVWNIGVVGLISSLPIVSYLTATAIMAGVYIINMFFKIQVNRIIAIRNQKYMIDKIIDYYAENAPRD